MILRAMLAVAYATGWACHARQIKGDDPDKKGYPGPPGWGVGRKASNATPLKNCYKPSNKTEEVTGPDRAVDSIMMIMKT
jgi:hypothetical protein